MPVHSPTYLERIRAESQIFFRIVSSRRGTSTQQQFLNLNLEREVEKVLIDKGYRWSIRNNSKIKKKIIFQKIFSSRPFIFALLSSFALDLSKILEIDTSTIEKEDWTKERNRKLLLVSCACFIIPLSVFYLYLYCSYCLSARKALDRNFKSWYEERFSCSVFFVYWKSGNK